MNSEQIGRRQRIEAEVAAFRSVIQSALANTDAMTGKLTRTGNHPAPLTQAYWRALTA